MIEAQETVPFSRKVKTFFQDVNAEFHKITWPHGKELVETTKMVTIFILVLAAFVFLCDKVLAAAIQALLTVGA